MIIIPEIETVVIQPPRTGTTALRKVLMETYPDAINLYRHMERDGIPEPYQHWKCVVQWRRPLDRLMSLYRYMRQPTSTSGNIHPQWLKDVRADTDQHFRDWIKKGKHPFTKRGQVGDEDFNPFYAVHYPDVPINRKGIQFWAQPKMGPYVLLPLELKEPFLLRNLLGLEPDALLPKLNASDPRDLDLAMGYGGDMHEIYDHLKKHHAWDLEQQQKLEMIGAI